jgi:hypothetical protein
MTSQEIEQWIKDHRPAPPDASADIRARLAESEAQRMRQAETIDRLLKERDLLLAEVAASRECVEPDRVYGWGDPCIADSGDCAWQRLDDARAAVNANPALRQLIQ